MKPLVRVSAAALAAVVFQSTAALAIEPDAPERLITAEEAAVIALRKRLVQVGLPKKPTQFQKGDAIDRRGLAKFYETNGGTLLWVTEKGLNDLARDAISEIAQADQWGLDPTAFALPNNPDNVPATGLTMPERIELEMAMSLAVLKYARYARGGLMDPKDLSLDIDRAPPVLPATEVLEGALAADDLGVYLRGLHPQHEQFKLLRTAYLKALEDEEDGAVAETEPQTSNKKRRKGRKARPKSVRILYNMEMWRWMPEELGERHVWANVPEFRIRVVKNGGIVHSERMITGKVKNKTPVFSDELETVVFHPFWGVPNSIKVKELLPKLQRGGGLERQGLKIRRGSRVIDPRSIDWNRTDIRNFHVYQPPGARNALGQVKFLFPNKHAVYFHDTPTKYLFKKKVRAFSHGCMRVRNPLQLAKVIFQQDRGWDMGKINALIKNGPKNNNIKLNRKVPVHVTYFTARVDEDGELQFFNDIYGHEKRIALGFAGKAHTIVKEDRSLQKYLGKRRGVARVASNDGNSFSSFFGNNNSSRSRSRRDSTWRRNVWGRDN